MVIVRKTVIEVVPSLTVIEYTPEAGAVPVPDVTAVAIDPAASVVFAAATKVVQPSGTPGEAVIVSCVFGLNPVTVR